MRPDFQTRCAKPEDAADCAAILQEWINETDWFPTLHPDSAAEPMLRSEIEKSGFTLAVKNQQIAGFSCMADDQLQFLYVRGVFRGQRVGAQLLNRCKFANPDGFGLWTFQQNIGARRFYQREGFVEIKRTNGEGNEEGLPDIRFYWEGKNV